MKKKTIVILYAAILTVCLYVTSDVYARGGGSGAGGGGYSGGSSSLGVNREDDWYRNDNDMCRTGEKSKDWEDSGMPQKKAAIKHDQRIKKHQRWEEEHLEYLRQNNPAKYEKVKARIKHRQAMISMRNESPDEFRQMISHMRKSRHNKWKRLREENPGKFAEIATGRRHHMMDRLHYLKNNDPERFEQAKRYIHRARFERFKQLKEENPEKFQQVMKKRKENFQKRLEILKTADPEKYERVQKRMQELKQYRQLAETNPEKAKECLDQNPGLERMLERHCWQTDDES